MCGEQDKTLKVKVDGGYLCATVSCDVHYPGIFVEFFADDDVDSASIPTVLMEKPVGGKLRALVWGDSDDEDYTAEILFD